ncbi:restriction endonuclease [Frankia sp. Cas3]|uniref:restriction endonuclease n=1 Tax=Frankia sp. Cas3 TaxID=3073926 RepID=UPI002AD488B6|nr:restriction endonuclease [Frankia sp. Cas3]
MDLDQALARFDRVEANLVRLEKAWAEIQALTPNGMTFGLGSGPEGERRRDLCRGYSQLLEGLPAIDGIRITETPWDIDDIMQLRVDLMDIGEWGQNGADRAADRIDYEIGEYRFHLVRTRRRLVRDHLVRLIADVDSLLTGLAQRTPNDLQPIEDEGFGRLRETFAQLERLLGAQGPTVGRWSDLRRHLSFGQGHDLHDIVNLDWPVVRPQIEAGLYSDLDPLPVEADDLGALLAEKPAGPVTVALNWAALSAEAFERLLFNLVELAPDYINPQWLMRTNAADRGRDISAELVTPNSLSLVQNKRVIIQAKHWQRRSVGVDELTVLLAQMKLWQPPAVHVLVIATSGRFTADAVTWIEKHNVDGERPEIHMWPESHLELLLARAPHLAAEFGLR